MSTGINITSTFITPRVQTVASAPTVTPTANDDLVVITAQAAALTLAAPTGTLVQGQALMIRIKDDGTARGITWTSGAGGYRAIGITLPTTTVISKTTYVGLIYNSTTCSSCIGTILHKAAPSFKISPKPCILVFDI